jgi:hypothetical protein
MKLNMHAKNERSLPAANRTLPHNINKFASSLSSALFELNNDSCVLSCPYDDCVRQLFGLNEEKQCLNSKDKKMDFLERKKRKKCSPIQYILPFTPYNTHPTPRESLLTQLYRLTKPTSKTAPTT